MFFLYYEEAFQCDVLPNCLFLLLFCMLLFLLLLMLTNVMKVFLCSFFPVLQLLKIISVFNSFWENFRVWQRCVQLYVCMFMYAFRYSVFPIPFLVEIIEIILSRLYFWYPTSWSVDHMWVNLCLVSTFCSFHLVNCLLVLLLVFIMTFAVWGLGVSYEEF